MGYESSPACKLLATHCCCCGRPLVDSVSVEAGIGPDCREKYGFDFACDPTLRAEANQLVYVAALHQEGGDEVVYAILRLNEMGFSKLASKIASRLGCVNVSLSATGRWFEVTSPFCAASLPSWRQIPGRYWNAAKKQNEVPIAQESALFSLLKKFYTGKIVNFKGQINIL